MEERQQILQQTRDMLAGMGAVLESGLAVLRRTADKMAAARRNDVEAVNKKNNIMAAGSKEER